MRNPGYWPVGPGRLQTCPTKDRPHTACAQSRLVVEYVSGDGSEEHDATPRTGKFWVYEQAIAAPYYAIFDPRKQTLELYRLNGLRYQAVEPNAADRYPVESLRIELGLWRGRYRGGETIWLRCWDAVTGEMLPSEEERTEHERRRAILALGRAVTAENLLDDVRRLLQEECERAETERKRAEALAERLRALGIDPNAV